MNELPGVTACDPSDNLREQQLRAEIVWLRRRLDAMNRLQMSQERIEAAQRRYAGLACGARVCQN